MNLRDNLNNMAGFTQHDIQMIIVAAMIFCGVPCAQVNIHNIHIIFDELKDNNIYVGNNLISKPQKSATLNFRGEYSIICPNVGNKGKGRTVAARYKPVFKEIVEKLDTIWTLSNLITKVKDNFILSSYSPKKLARSEEETSPKKKKKLQYCGKTNCAKVMSMLDQNGVALEKGDCCKLKKSLRELQLDATPTPTPTPENTNNSII
eukprot:6558_1